MGIIYLRFVVLSVVIVGCGPKGMTLPPIQRPTEADLKQKFGVEQDLPYIQDDTFISAPTGLLGQVIMIRKLDGKGKCPTAWVDGKPEFAVDPLKNFEIDPESVLKQPIKRDSKIVTADLAANVGFLSYLSAELKGNRVISAILFDQAAARVADKKDSWTKAIESWKTANAALMQDADVCYLAVVRGIVQKNLVRRTFTETSGSTAAGAYGVNVGGKYHTSSEDYSVDVRFGLSLGILKRPPSPTGIGIDANDPERAPTENELTGASTLTTIAHPTRP